MSPNPMVNIDASWPETMDIPDMPAGVKTAIRSSKRPAYSQRKKMIRDVVEAMTKCHPNPNLTQCRIVARRIVRKHPDSFEDRTDEGERMGNGYHSMAKELRNRIEYVTRANTQARLRRPRARNPDDTTPRTPADAYGCISWQPELPDDETEETLRERKQLLDEINSKGEPITEKVNSVIQKAMQDTYYLQRKYINAVPSPTMKEIEDEWPFLFQQRSLLMHFKTLTGIPVSIKLSESFASKGERILAYFKHLDAVGTRRKAVHNVAEQMKEAAQQVDNPDDVKTPGVVLMVMANFKEDPESLFILADVSSLHGSNQ